MEHTEYIAHLQGIVQIPTVSSVNDASTDWSEFDRLHRFLQEAYPFIFDSIKKRNIHNLVLDLRDNTGGYVSDINYLYSFLTSRNEKQMVTSDDVKVSSKYTMVNKYFRKPNVIGYTVGLPFVLYGSVKSLFNIHKKDTRCAFCIGEIKLFI